MEYSYFSRILHLKHLSFVWISYQDTWWKLLNFSRKKRVETEEKQVEALPGNLKV